MFQFFRRGRHGNIAIGFADIIDELGYGIDVSAVSGA
jgi:hypothetical protein